MNDTTTMVERLLAEGDKIGMTAAGVLLGENQGGSPVHATTVARWCMKGARLPSGHRVKLEHFRCGNKLVTTRAAIIRFLAAQTEQPGEIAGPRTATERLRDDDKAARELAQLGI